MLHRTHLSVWIERLANPSYLAQRGQVQGSVDPAFWQVSLLSSIRRTADCHFFSP